MSQEQVIKVLKKYKRPLSLSQIADHAKENKILIAHSIARMVKNKSIKLTEIDRIKAKEYGCKRRMRLYFI